MKHIYENIKGDRYKMRLTKTLDIITVLTLLTLTACTGGNTSLSGNTSSQQSISSNANNSKASSTSPASGAQGEEWPDTPVSDFEYEYNGELQGVVITKYIGESMKPRIPDTIEGEPVTGIGHRAFWYAKIATAYIPDTVISIHGFYGSEITRIAIPDSVIDISHGAFENCRSLDEVSKNAILAINPDAFGSGEIAVNVPAEASIK